jgi:hypothetical protein
MSANRKFSAVPVFTSASRDIVYVAGQKRGSRRSELQGQWHHTSAKRTSRYRSGAFPRSGFVDTIVISPSDSTNLDAVVALTRGDETVLEAVSVFIDHAGTLIEQGGPMVLLSAPPKGLCRS